MTAIMNIESKWLECWAPPPLLPRHCRMKIFLRGQVQAIGKHICFKDYTRNHQKWIQCKACCQLGDPDHLCRTSFPFKRTLCHENEMKPIVGLHVRSLESRLNICQSQNVKVRWTVNASLEAIVVQIWESFAAPIRHDAKLPNSSRLCCRSSYK